MDGRHRKRITRRPRIFRGANYEVMHCQDRLVLLTGPAGTGKSTASLSKAYQFASEVPGARILLYRKTRASLTQSILVTFERDVVPPNDPILKGPHRQNRSAYRFRNRSEIVLAGMDEPERIKSSEYDLIIAYEAIELNVDDWELPVSRLRNYAQTTDGQSVYQQAIAECNPGGPDHWLIQRARAGKMRLLETSLEDNPRYYELQTKTWSPEGEDYIQTLDNLTGANKMRLRFGRWVAEEGAVFDQVWDPTKHCIPAVPVDELGDSVIKWHFAAVDWGYRHPGVILVFGVDENNVMYCVHQIYKSEQTHQWWKQQAEAIQREYQPTVFVCDSEEPGHIEEFRSAGLHAIKAIKDRKTGRECVENRLKLAPDGTCGLYYVKDSVREWVGGKWISGVDQKLLAKHDPVNTEQEYYRYVWPKTADGRPMKEEPVPRYDDGISCTRYACMYAEHMEFLPEPSVLDYAWGTAGQIAGHAEAFGEQVPAKVDPFK